MSDPIDRISSNTTRATERISASNQSGLRLKRDDDNMSAYEDQVDIHPAWRMQNDASELALSIAMIRALVAGELPPEAISALETYAPLGDMELGEYWCDRVEQKGHDTVLWLNTMTLSQALERAAK